MYRLMIADDEQIVQDGLKFLIEDIFDDIEIVATASSGREAIEQCQQTVPDIILMDIKMPGINGIEAIEIIKKRYQHIKFIIISAYEQFEFAKHAVELGVSDYILKPVNSTKLVEVLKKVTTSIDEERHQRQQEMANKEKLDKIIPVLEHGFIYALLLNSDYPGVLAKYQDLFEANKDKGYVMTIELGDNEQGQNKIGSSVKGQASYATIHNLIKYKCKCVVGPMIINRVTLLVYEDVVSDSEYEQRIKAIELAENIRQAIEREVDTSCSIGIGAYHSLESCGKSLDESLFALSRMSQEPVLHVNDIKSMNQVEEEYSYGDMKSDENSIIQLMESGDEDRLYKELSNFLNAVEKKCKGNLENVRNIVMELMVMVLSCSYKNALTEEEVGYTTYLEELKQLNNMVTLKNWCIHKVKEVSKAIQGNRTKHVSRIVIDAQAYIDEHYNEEITLIDVSKEVAVSPQYFSKIFKEEIGLSYVEYVRKKRIEVAKEMLRTKNYSVKEICYHIGYNDPNYFSRLFKKLIGVSPTDFK